MSSMIRTSSLFLFLLVSIFGYAQPKTPQVLKHLLDQKREIPFISGYLNGLISADEIPRTIALEKQFLVKTKDRLLVLIDGSGVVFEYLENKPPTRLDTTSFMGNNFNALVFNRNNQLYSYGGYGYWRSNGLLRKYDSSSRQWNVVKLNKELPMEIPHTDFWFDTALNKIYLIVKKIHHDGLIHAVDTNSALLNTCYKLDLNTKEWELLGQSSFKDLNRYNFQSPWGALEIINPDSIRILDFRNNLVGNLKPESHHKLNRYFNHRQVAEIRYFIDSTLFFGNTTADYLDSIPFSLSDFSFDDQKVYLAKKEKITKSNSFDALHIALLILSLGLLVFIAVTRKRYSKIIAEVPYTDVIVPTNFDTMNPNGDISKKEMATSSKAQTIFTEIEKSLLQLALEKEKQDYYISIEELNKITGVSNKNESIQKKTRSETINSINQKYQLLLGAKDLLIDKRRSEFDKRSYEYFINKNRMEWVEKILGDNRV